MQINLTGDSVEITDSMEEVINSKLNRKIGDHFDFVQSIDVIFRIENLDHICEANASLKGTKLNAKASAENMYTAIDELVNKLVTQIKKYRDKQTHH